MYIGYSITGGHRLHSKTKFRAPELQKSGAFITNSLGGKIKQTFKPAATGNSLDLDRQTDR